MFTYFSLAEIVNSIHIPLVKKSLLVALSGVLLVIPAISFISKMRSSGRHEKKDLKKQFVFMQSLIETIPNPIFFIDYQNDEFGCNEAFLAMTGNTKAKLKKLGIEKLFSVSEKQPVEIGNRNGNVRISEMKLKYPDGSIHNMMYSKANINVDERKTGLVGVFTDISEIRNAEIALRELETELKAANRTKNRFFSLIAHDLKNPFHAIMGLAHLLKSNFENLSDEERATVADSIHRSSENTYQLLLNLLDWARLQEGTLVPKPDRIKIEDLVHDELTIHKNSIDAKKLKTSVELIPGITVWADDNMVRTVIRNLLSNAIKFTPDGGEISLNSRLRENQVEFSIRDTGVGIAPGDLLNLFEVEKSGRANSMDNTRGTGLGLMVCKDFIELNEGSIRAESELGKGTSFYFSLPAQAPG
jgi:PAS domain S-box-containing protein